MDLTKLTDRQAQAVRTMDTMVMLSRQSRAIHETQATIDAATTGGYTRGPGLPGGSTGLSSLSEDTTNKGLSPSRVRT